MSHPVSNDDHGHGQSRRASCKERRLPHPLPTHDRSALLSAVRQHTTGPAEEPAEPHGLVSAHVTGRWQPLERLPHWWSYVLNGRSVHWPPEVIVPVVAGGATVFLAIALGLR